MHNYVCLENPIVHVASQEGTDRSCLFNSLSLFKIVYEISKSALNFSNFLISNLISVV